MIKVSNIPNKVTEDALMLFFESQRRSGGGNVTEVRYHRLSRSAVIIFEDPEVVNKVLKKKPIILMEEEIHVVELNPAPSGNIPILNDDDDDDDGHHHKEKEKPGCTIKVHGVNESSTRDSVQMHFENKRKSGGDTVVKIVQSNDIYRLTFESPTVVERILQKSHRIDGTSVKVKLHIESSPTTSSERNGSVVFIQGISQTTTKDGLTEFLQDKSGILIGSMELTKMEGTAVVTFQKEIDFKKLYDKCQRIKLDGENLKLHKVPDVSWVMSRGVTKELSSTKCDLCNKEDRELETFCFVCKERHCHNCTDAHATLVNRHHCTINLKSGEMTNAVDELSCDGCETQSVVSALSFCHDCCELQCEVCHAFHSTLDITRQHKITKGNEYKRTTLDESSTTIDASSATLHESSATLDETSVPMDDSRAILAESSAALDESSATSDKPKADIYSTDTDSDIIEVTLPELMYQCTVNTRSKFDKNTCFIQGVTWLPDGRAVVLDSNNNTVKVYSEEYKYCYEVQYRGDLWGITVVSPDTVVLIEGRVLRYLQLGERGGSKLNESISITPTGMSAVAISYAVDTFAIMCIEPPIVVIYESKRKLRSDFELSEIKEKPAPSILLNDRGDRFYVCDQSKRLVLCYSLIYSEYTRVMLMWKYSVVSWPYSLGSIDNCLIALCHTKVIMIDNDGKKIHLVHLRGCRFDFSSPCIAVETNKRRIAITSAEKGEVKIFQC